MTTLLHSASRVARGRAVGLLLVSGCAGPGISAPDRLPLLVVVTVAGEAATGNDLRIILDGVPAAELPAAGGRVTIQVRTGRRTVELAGFAGACAVQDGPQRRMNVQPGRAAFVASFELECGA
jgi:hypothetical protein